MRGVLERLPIPAPLQPRNLRAMPVGLPQSPADRLFPRRLTVHPRYGIEGQAPVVGALAASGIRHYIARFRPAFSIESVLFIVSTQGAVHQHIQTTDQAFLQEPIAHHAHFGDELIEYVRHRYWPRQRTITAWLLIHRSRRSAAAPTAKEAKEAINNAHLILCFMALPRGRTPAHGGR